MDKKNNKHHIWCSFFMKPRKNCKMCKRLFKEYPENNDEMIKKYFPNVKVKGGAMMTE